MTGTEGGHETDHARWSSPFVAMIGSGLLALAIAAGAGAYRAHGRVFPGLFVDPHGSFSAVHWPSWQSADLPLRFTDRLIAVDGAPLPPAAGRFDLPAHRISAHLEAVEREGRSQAALTFDTSAGPVTLARPLRRLGVDEAAFFFGFYALMAVFALWSGLMVFVLARRRAGAVAYGWWSVGNAVFMLTFYDYHSTASLAPLFSLSTVGVQVGAVWLLYSFPEPPRRARRLLRGATITFTAVAAAVALVLMVGPYAGLDLRALRVAVAFNGLASLALLAIGVLARLVLARSQDQRRELRSAVWGLAAVPALLAIGFFLLALTGTGAVHLLLPFLVPLFPLSIGYALIRHNILGTTAVLTRRMFVAPVLTAALAAALLVYLVLDAVFPAGGAGRGVPWVASALTLGGVALVGHRVSGRIFFAATARFRPTLQQLADDLASKRNAPEICGAIQEAVTRWLPTEQATVVLPGELHQIPGRPAGLRTQMAEGRSAWTTEPHTQRRLLVPMRSQGGLRGILALAPKHQAALYTREELELCETIASLGAVALHNAEALSELELLRRFEVEAARDDKRLTLGLLGAEIAHEIAYPLNFLRYLLRQGDSGQPLEVQDLEVGREEIGRLERMFAALHRLRIPVPQLAPVLVLPRVRRALDLIREMLSERRISVAVDVPPDLTVTADPDGLVQIFANLLRNAAQAAGAGGSIGARSRPEPDGTMRLEVWDEGPGVSEELAATIFNPFVTAGKQGSMGLGLAVTQRLVRTYGWRIHVDRREARTVFGIEIPPPRPSRDREAWEEAQR
jgi:signal transduction histidine kinase